LILPSGKGLNVARTAHALGSAVLTTGLVAGSCGRWICALLHQAHIPERFFWFAEGESRTATILVDPERGQTTAVKCNQHEAAQVQGRPIETPAQAVEAAQRWVSRGIRQVVITLGSEGAVAASDDGAWHVTAPGIDPLSPIGSGDAMMAGLVLALAQGQALAEATRVGVAVGTANALRLGSGCCDLDALPALLGDTRVKQAAHPSSGHAAAQDERD
jgi:fructose-1-phosphate kinase PfkB-like protein